MSDGTAANRFFLRGDTAVSINRSIDAAPHSHYALQITLALEEPFAMAMRPGGEWRDYNALIIDSGVEHRYSSKGKPQAIILLNPLSALGRALRRKFQLARDVREIPSEASQTLKISLRESDPMDKLFDALDALISREEQDDSMHEKIKLVLDIMHDKSSEKLSLAYLADKAFMSESHLTHLFKKITGSPIRRHLMWIRATRAVDYLFAGKGNLTMAAHEAGFSDSAHFSRTFKLMFGISPGDFLKGHALGRGS